MSFVSYAQNFEDVVLWRAFHHVPHGRYLDIGAQDPILDSVSRAFYLAGWRGIHLEPTAHYAARLRADRPEEMVIQAAVSDEPGLLALYEIPNTGLSTGIRSIAERHHAAGFAYQTIEVPSIRLDQLFPLFGEDPILWMKVDVEGMEKSVFASWGESPARPLVLVVESTEPNSKVLSHQPWIGELATRGYREALFDGLSRYFVADGHDDILEMIRTPANIFDQFTISDTHFAAGTLNGRYQRYVEETKGAVEDAARNVEISAELERQTVENKALSVRLAATETERSELLDQLSVVDAERNMLTGRLADAQVRLAEALSQLDANHAGRRSDIERMAEERRLSELELHRQWREEEGRWRSEAEGAIQLFNGIKAELESALQRASRAEELVETLRQSEQRLTDTQAELAAVRERSYAAQVEVAGLSNRLDADQVRLSEAAEIMALFVPRIRKGLARWWGRGPRRSSLDDRISHWLSSVPTLLNDGPPRPRDHEMTTNTPTGSPYHRANSLAELCAWSDIDFVRCSFVTVLGRQPDVEGERYYVDRLRRGYSKMQLLRQLRESAEARSHDPGIAGFDRALKAAYWRELQMFSRFGTRSPSGKDAAPATPDAAPGASDALLAPSEVELLTPSSVEEKLNLILFKLDAMQESHAFLQGAVLRGQEMTVKHDALSGDEIFKRRLAATAQKFRSPQ